MALARRKRAEKDQQDKLRDDILYAKYQKIVNMKIPVVNMLIHMFKNKIAKEQEMKKDTVLLKNDVSDKSLMQTATPTSSKQNEGSSDSSMYEVLTNNSNESLNLNLDQGENQEISTGRNTEIETRRNTQVSMRTANSPGKKASVNTITGSSSTSMRELDTPEILVTPPQLPSSGEQVESTSSLRTAVAMSSIQSK
jgi:hypothetical protein